MLILSHAGHEIELALDTMIIIKNTTEKDYFKLANEDLKVEFDAECLYIHPLVKNTGMLFLIY
jgi:hypothetical protein